MFKNISAFNSNKKIFFASFLIFLMIFYTGYFIKINNISNEFFFEKGYTPSKEEEQIINDMGKIDFNELITVLKRKNNYDELTRVLRKKYNSEFLKKYDAQWLETSKYDPQWLEDAYEIKTDKQRYIITFPTDSSYLFLKKGSWSEQESTIGKFQYRRKCLEDIQYCKII